MRLTDKARTRDVTALLRGKFGLPPISHSNKHHMQQPSHVHSALPNKLPTRLSQCQKSDSIYTAYNTQHASSFDDEKEKEVDALVLVGTIEGPPRGYIRFEHEDFLEEQSRIDAFRQFKFLQRRQQRYHEQERNQLCTSATGLQVSESAATVRASGGQPGWMSSMLLAPSSGIASITSGSSGVISGDEGLGGTNVMGASSSTIGLDLSCSRGSAVFGGVHRTTPWGSMVGEEFTDPTEALEGILSSSTSSRGRLASLASELSVSTNRTVVAGNTDPSTPNSKPVYHPALPPLEYEHDTEPIHIVRTVRPDEHPLKVRDEMMTSLIQLRQKAETEMGLRLQEESLLGKQLAQPKFRWYFQPCSALGGIGDSFKSPKIQSIPSYIDLEGYCTGDEEEEELDDGDDSDECVRKLKIPRLVSRQMQQLAKERLRVAMLRDLADPSYLVSGYLLKQSTRDPNIWRRVYCVLSEDRLWIIARMKPLKRNNESDHVILGNEDMLASLRVSQHAYIKLHRSLLIEGGDGSTASDSSHDGSFVSPLGRRLPNTFRILTSHGTSHTFRSFNAPSFRVWVTSLGEKITQKHRDGLMDLADLIAEEETMARSRRLDEVAVFPLLNKLEDVNCITSLSDGLVMDITRFGMSVAAYKELCRHIESTIQSRRNHEMVLNAQTKVGIGQSKSKPPSSGGQRDSDGEHIGMVSALWEDVRSIASRSAQLLHDLATLQRDSWNNDSGKEDYSIRPTMDSLLKDQKEIQMILGRRWDILRKEHEQSEAKDAASDVSAEINHLTLPPLPLFDSLLKNFQTVTVAMQS